MSLVEALRSDREVQQLIKKLIRVGRTPQDYASGSHKHDGSDSVPLGFAPTGSVFHYGGDGTPKGWLFCDGSAVSRTTYAALFSVIGTKFGSGDGSTTFNVPQLGNIFIMGATAGGGFTGGESAHVLTTAEMPSHNHGGSSGGQSVDHTHTLPFEWVATTTAGGTATRVTDIDNKTGGTGTNSNGTTSGSSVGHTHSIPTVGADAAHENRPPYLTLRGIIKT